MKIKFLAPLLLSGLLAYACASEDYNTQKGAAIGAIGGALVGQAIGRNTAGTLIGAAGGALVGAVAGNAVDQSNQQSARASAERASAATCCALRRHRQRSLRQLKKDRPGNG